MVDGIEKREQPPRFVTLSESRKCDHGPQRGVSILTTVLANAWRITPYITGIEASLIERRRENKRKPVLITDQFSLDGRHSVGGSLGVCGSGNHRPCLRD